MSPTLPTCLMDSLRRSFTVAIRSSTGFPARVLFNVCDGLEARATGLERNVIFLELLLVAERRLLGGPLRGSALLGLWTAGGGALEALVVFAAAASVGGVRGRAAASTA